jgi:nitrilase
MPFALGILAHPAALPPDAEGIPIYCAPTADRPRNLDAHDAAYRVRRPLFRRLGLPVHSSWRLSCGLLGDPGRRPTDRVDARCGGSLIVNPLGRILIGPDFSGERILTADLDPGEIAEGKVDLDVVGHYARPDVFWPEVNEKASS